MNVYKLIVMVIDYDSVGLEETISCIENARYPNRCIGPSVISSDTRKIDFSDDHPLNKTNTYKQAFLEFFSKSPKANNKIIEDTPITNCDHCGKSQEIFRLTQGCKFCGKGIIQG